ncbi:Nitrate regulatory gene2 protein [Bienertia sinuspersici]
MGCAGSRLHNEERVQNCKKRKRAIKQLVGFRREFANAILAYLKALKDTGITLRQFTESESLELETVESNLPSSPPLPLPPSPPLPPPIDSPDSRKLESNQNGKEPQEEIAEVGEERNYPSPPPSSSRGMLDLLESPSPHQIVDTVLVEDVDDENWAETRSQFEEEDLNHGTSGKAFDTLKLKSTKVDEISPIVIGKKKDMVNRATVLSRRRKTLACIVRELDDYFLKASAGGKEIAVLVDMSSWNTSMHPNIKERKGKGNTSARLSSLSWSVSSRSLQVTRNASEVGSPIEPCKPGAHCITLGKILAEEQTLYTAVKEEEMAKLEHERKSFSLQKLESDNVDLNKIEKIRGTVETLQSDMVRLQELVRKTSTSILTTIDVELHPQLVALLTGLIYMWRTMYECHQIQNRIVQQVHHLTTHDTEPSMENRREAAMQLESGVSFWYNSFCRLTKSQRDYVETICRWIQLIDIPVDGKDQNCCPSMFRNLCENGSLPLIGYLKSCQVTHMDTETCPCLTQIQDVAEAIKSFLLVIRSIMAQQQQERSLKKKLDRLEWRLQKEVKSLVEMEKKLELSGLSPKHTLSEKREKTDTLKKLYENEKGKYLSTVEGNRVLTLSNLQQSLPCVFEALMGFSSACTQAFETALNNAHQVCNAQQSQAQC